MSDAGRSRGTRSTKLAETVTAIPEVSAQDIKKEENPFTHGDWRMLSYAWSGFALRVLLVLATIFSAYQYLQAREEKRIERALELVELWERQEYQEAQRALKRRLADLNQRYRSDLGSNPSAAELAIFQDRVGVEALTEGGGTMPLADFRDAFDRNVYFLNRLSFCVEGGLCSRAVADAYFLDYARSFWAYFSGFIRQERRRGSPNFAKAIEDYVSRSD